MIIKLLLRLVILLSVLKIIYFYYFILISNYISIYIAIAVFNNDLLINILYIYIN